jgi:hypothetical protein
LATHHSGKIVDLSTAELVLINRLNLALQPLPSMSRMYLYLSGELCPKPKAQSRNGSRHRAQKVTQLDHDGRRMITAIPMPTPLTMSGSDKSQLTDSLVTNPSSPQTCTPHQSLYRSLHHTGSPHSRNPHQRVSCSADSFVVR